MNGYKFENGKFIDWEFPEFDTLKAKEMDWIEYLETLGWFACGPYWDEESLEFNVFIYLMRINQKEINYLMEIETGGGIIPVYVSSFPDLIGLLNLLAPICQTTLAFREREEQMKEKERRRI